MNKAAQKPRQIALFHNAARSKIIHAFVGQILKVTRELSFKKRYVEFSKFIEGVIDFSGIVFDENDRLIFEPGETAIMKATFSTAKREMPQRMVFLMGTEYGLAVLHGAVDSYSANGTDIDGDLPTLHTTSQLRAATARHLKRTANFDNGMNPFATDSQVMEWVLSPTFREECAAQAALDQANQIPIGDGMKIFEKKPFVPREPHVPKKNHFRNKSRKAQAPNQASA